ncbi:DUF927 domain-containing protein [Pasteurella multocida]
MMNGTIKKLKNAPHLSEQDKAPYSEIIALVGDKAWNAWGIGQKKGKSEEWDLLRQAIQAEPNYKPIILGPTQLGELSKLKLAEDNHSIFKCCIFGELTIPQEKGLLLNLANNSQIQTLIFYDELGQEKYNLTHKLAQLREDEKSRKDEEEIARLAEIANAPKTSPYVDYREVGELKGLFYVIPKLDNQTGEILREEQKWICSPLKLIGNGKNEQGEYFYIFQWQNADEEKPRIEALNCGDFGTETAWRLLKNKGLKMTAKSLTQHLVEHFHSFSERVEKWTVTHCTGWHNGAYLLPNGEIIGNSTTPIIFKNKSASATGYDTSGTLESWQNEIAQYVNKNTSMMLGIATALSSPLLRLLNADSFGVHLFDSSSKGKTTTLNIANSIYGNPSLIDLSWNMTPTALNNEASSRNDGFITLDELGQAKKIYEVENIAYSLFNEKGRGQGMKEGGNNELNRWKITALSTGEKDVEGFLKSKGIEINAGQLVRLLNVPLTEATHLHCFHNNKSHADHLNEATMKHYGIVGREWINYLSENKQTIKEEYKRLNNIWQNRLQNAKSQVQRVASRFAILETALQLSKHLTLWTEEDCREAIIKSFNDWLADYGTNDREETKIIEFFNGWLDENAESCFIQIPESTNTRTINKILGYRILEIQGIENEHFYIHPKAFNDVIAMSGFPKKIVFEKLAQYKMIRPSAEQKTRPYQHKAPSSLEKQINSKGKRFYIIHPYLIEDEEQHTT